MTGFDRPGWSAAIDRVTQNTPAVPPRTAGATGEAGLPPVPGLPTLDTAVSQPVGTSVEIPPKWPLRVHEAWDGGCVEITTDEACAVKQVVLDVVERGSSSASNRLRLAEVDALIAALQTARAEIAEPEYLLADCWSEEVGHFTGTVLRSTLARDDAWLREHAILRLLDGDQVLRVSSLAQPVVLADPTLPPRTMDDALAAARAELLANSTPVEDRELTEVGNLTGGNYYASAVQAATERDELGGPPVAAHEYDLISDRDRGMVARQEEAAAEVDHVHTEGQEDCTHRLPQCCPACHVDGQHRASHGVWSPEQSEGFSRIIWEGTDDKRAELAAEKRAELASEDQGTAALALVAPVALGGGMLILAGVSGKLSYLAEHLPVTVSPNGFTLLVVSSLAALLWLVFRRPVPAEYELADWVDDEDDAEPADAYSDPYLGTDADHDPTGWRP